MELTRARLQIEHEFAAQSPEDRQFAMQGVAADLLELQRERDALRELGDSGW
jgi:hypothetical protein